MPSSVAHSKKRHAPLLDHAHWLKTTDLNKQSKSHDPVSVIGFARFLLLLGYVSYMRIQLIYSEFCNFKDFISDTERRKIAFSYYFVEKSDGDSIYFLQLSYLDESVKNTMSTRKS